MKKNKILEKRRLAVKKDAKLFVEHSFSIANRIHDILEEKNIDQKNLAQLLGKNESEISKWLRGTHNFTLKTISKIEAVLGEAIINKVEQDSETVPDFFELYNSLKMYQVDRVSSDTTKINEGNDLSVNVDFDEISYFANISSYLLSEDALC